MSAKAAVDADRTGVVLLCIGVGKREFELPEGSTLADLLRLAGTRAESGEVFIDGRPLADCLVLPPGAIVSVVPRPKNAELGDWRSGAGVFQDRPIFEEMMAEIATERDAGTKHP